MKKITPKLIKKVCEHGNGKGCLGCYKPKTEWEEKLQECRKDIKDFKKYVGEPKTEVKEVKKGESYRLGYQQGVKEEKENWIKLINETLTILGNDQIKLSNGKLPYTIFMGKATEEEKIALYSKGLEDFYNLITRHKK